MTRQTSNDTMTFIVSRPSSTTATIIALWFGLFLLAGYADTHSFSDSGGIPIATVLACWVFGLFRFGIDKTNSEVRWNGRNIYTGNLEIGLYLRRILIVQLCALVPVFRIDFIDNSLWHSLIYATLPPLTFMICTLIAMRVGWAEYTINALSFEHGVNVVKVTKVLAAVYLAVFLYSVLQMELIFSLDITIIKYVAFTLLIFIWGYGIGISNPYDNIET